jgi:hypothetical protein
MHQSTSENVLIICLVRGLEQVQFALHAQLSARRALAITHVCLRFARDPPMLAARLLARGPSAHCQ